MIPLLMAVVAFQNVPSTPPVDEAADLRFRACTAQVRTDAERAIEEASAWQAQGGGFHARQCLGLAYVALERWAEAAGVFEQAAREAEAAQAPHRADLWVQAGNAWLAAGDTTRALSALDSALATSSLTDELRGEVHLDRARVLVQTGNHSGARQDLDRALQLVPGDPMAWYLSAALAQRRNDLTRAQADIQRAMQLAPNEPDIMLLAGTLAGLGGNMTEAERLYRLVVQRAPDSEAGRAAQASLATLREIEMPAPAPGATPPQPPSLQQPALPQQQPPPQQPQSR